MVGYVNRGADQGNWQTGASDVHASELVKW